MFFCTCEHYNDNQPIYYEYDKNNEDKECFICFDIKTNDESNPISLKKQNLYITNCHCDSFAHKKCLQIWFEKNKNCPICRILVIEKTTLFITNKYYTYIYFNLINMSKVTFKIMSFLFIFYFFIEYYLMYNLFYNKYFDNIYKANNINITLID